MKIEEAILGIFEELLSIIKFYDEHPGGNIEKKDLEGLIKRQLAAILENLDDRTIIVNLATTVAGSTAFPDEIKRMALKFLKKKATEERPNRHDVQS